MIKNLIPGLPEMGKIKAGTKGEEVVSSQNKKFRLPKKLDHFIITTTERDDNDNLILDTDLMDTLKSNGNAIVDDDNNLTGIPIRLLYNNIDLNFPTRYACYVGGKCVCSGDGEEAHTRDGRDVKCPCEKLDFNYAGRDKCKANGKLQCIVDGASMVGACHVLRTTSINTVKSIIAGLAFIQAAASGHLAFLPLHLVLKPRTVTIPSGAPSTIYVSSIVYRGSIEELRQNALGMAKEKAQYLIEMDKVEESARELMDQAVESDKEQEDVQAEFYPDAVEVVPEGVDEAKSDKKPEVEKKEPVPKKAPKPEKLEVQKEEPKQEAKPDPLEMIVKEQKKQILLLKKKNNITNPETWAALLKPFKVKTANNLTREEADAFIEVLKTNPF